MAPAKIVIVGGGFSGVECARYLERHLRPEEAFVQLVTPDAGLLYLPLLPQVASGVLNPRSISVSLRRVLRRTEVVPGMAIGVHPVTRQVVVRRSAGAECALDYDHLVLVPGSITRVLDVPGLQEHGFGMKTLAEAMFLRDHVLQQLDVAAVRGEEDEDRERLNFVTIGAGYAGTETTAVLNKVTQAAARRYFPKLESGMVRWHLVTHGDRIMPELGERLQADAKRHLAERGIELIFGASAKEVTAHGVTLTNGRTIRSRTVVWTAGVAPSPLAGHLGADTDKGRIVADADLTVPGLTGVWACGDAAHVPDLATGGDAVCAPTAQHAMRQGRHLGKNLVAELRGGRREPYRHPDLGMVVDLGGKDALARPLKVGLRGVPAQFVTRGYHLMALRTIVARARVAFDWTVHGLSGDDFLRIGYGDYGTHTIGGFEQTGCYLPADEIAPMLDALGPGERPETP
ncbi:NAD(P)/FAD-dependent oxidoreductase [Nocardia terpenica]|uniref:NAD(P)/FAD-dependent oxidoreductase n=1 Tax=Nocardia terpenica TaxID=455432 RepID=A0A6G9Z1U5_9NOCA|nr:FAD-dependent oxidoreductase [Nocardia terpenica]QIS19478.1 NAD(P)/FAD-dependent oxidoreductase [Nocardia terpenica]